MGGPRKHHRRATQRPEALPEEAGNVSLPRAIVLQKKDGNRETLGFPPLNRAEPKRVVFSTPVSAGCMSVDGLWSTDCLVLSVWDAGAQLEVSLPGHLAEFYLLFTSPPRPVFRQCRRISTRGRVIEVAYLWKQPAFVLNAGMGL